MSATSVLIVDDHARVRETLRMILDFWQELKVVGEASSGPEAIHLSKELHPDVVLMDLDMPGMDGTEATRMLCKDNPDIRILILTATVEFDRIDIALAAGAMGYVLKTAHIDEIGTAILATADKDAS